MAQDRCVQEKAGGIDMNWEALPALLLTVFVCWAIYKVGVKGIYELIHEALYRLIEGPKKAIPHRKTSCLVQHMIAASEMNCYGEIMSESVDEHLKTCKKFALRKDAKGDLRAVPASYAQVEMMGARLAAVAGDPAPKVLSDTSPSSPTEESMSIWMQTCRCEVPLPMLNGQCWWCRMRVKDL